MDVAVIWIVAGLVLILAEFALTSFVIVFFGVAALLVGLLLAAGMSSDHGIPYLVFAALSVALVVVLRRRFRDWFTGRTLSGDVDEDFIGHDARVEAGFGTNDAGRGKVAYRGASWDARSRVAELAVGSVVRIVGRQGSLLEIEPVEI